MARNCTDIGARCAVGDAVKQADQATCISNRLLIPNNLLFRTMTLVLGAVFVFLNAELLVCLTDGKHQKQRVGGPRNEGE
jgi:hypothetical protein